MIIQKNTFSIVFLYNVYHNNTKISLVLLKYICLPTCITQQGVYLLFFQSHVLHCHSIDYSIKHVTVLLSIHFLIDG